MSNIESLDYRRKSLGQLQRVLEEHQKELQSLRDKVSWQEMYIETLEVQFSEFKDSYELLNETVLRDIRALHSMVFKLNNTGE
jgi:predicted RNase H-like nuclease (RuvC/YqgF family)